MTETQRRIQAYKRALPHMKERVMAVALLFVISISMMVSASFAWITLSRAPEVNGLATTIATNGNLEIALSNPEGTEPDATKVGDGLGDIIDTNLTWGNLINLSDIRYGLSDITLRPAMLNMLNLKNSPINAVEYGSDGRVSGYITEFAFTNYEKKGNAYAYVVPTDGITKYGVRAVSSVKYKDLVGESFLYDQLKLIELNFGVAQSSFGAIYKSDSYMQTVSYFVGIYTNYYLDSGNNPNCDGDRLNDLQKMTHEFELVLKDIGQVIVDIANLYYYQSLLDNSQYTPFTVADLIEGKIPTTYTDRILAYTESVSGFKSAWTKTQKAISGIDAAVEKHNKGEGVKWKNIETPINYLCDMSSAKIDGYTVAEVKQMAKNLDMSLLSILDKPLATICGGAIKDADYLLSGDFRVNSSDNVVISISYSFINRDVKPDIETDAPAATSCLLPLSIAVANDAAQGGTSDRGQAVAAETYAMAIDMWVRTNASDSLLILEGETKHAQKKGTFNGTQIGLLYSWKTKDADGVDVDILVYENNGTYYYDGTDTPTETIPNKVDLTVVEEEKPYAYEGVNRVWNETEDSIKTEFQISDNSILATQGSGSCYIFYPQSPEDQEQSLKVLSAMRVVFVDDEGQVLATAKMQTSKVVEDSGRVLVPLLLEANEKITIDDEGNTEDRYITRLVQNEAKRITALIYLEGEELTNSDVLSAGSITGQLNIQFGTTDMDLDAVDEDDVKSQHYEFEFTPSTEKNSPYTFENSGNSENVWELDLKLYVSGTQPNNVKGNFISVINSSQGARQQLFTMEKNDDGVWEAKVPFYGPGNYQLRSIQINGVDYPLTEEDIVYVKVPGTTVKSISWDVDNNFKSVLTAEKVHQQSLNLTLNSSAGKVHAVKGIFIGDNGQNITVDFTTQNGTDYNATSIFSSSGTYELTYVYIDGVITPLAESQYKTLSVQLGLKAEINILAPVLRGGDDATVLKPESVLGDMVSGWSFVYSPTPGKEIDFKVTCRIYDDQNKPISNLPKVKLYYKAGSVKDALDSDMIWSSNSGKYEGQFTLDGNGVFSFQNVIVNDVNYITSAIVSPTIKSTSPDPMKYVEQETQPVVYEIGLPENERTLSVMLKNAATADLTVTLENADGNEITYSMENEEHADKFSVITDRESGISTYKIIIPDDGQWTITDLKIGNVFYGNTYYSGNGNVADLKNEVLNDNITTYFLTKIKVSVENAPKLTPYTGTFMTDHEVKDMAISVTTSNGHMLSDVLTELKIKYPDAGIKDNVTVGMTYKWNGVNGYSYSGDASNLPQRDFGSESISPNATDGKFYIGTMNFKLAGTYVPEFKITIGDDTYDAETKVIVIPSSLKSSSLITVTWDSPEVVFTGSSGNSSNSISNNNHTITLYYKGQSSGCLTDYIPSSVTAKVTGIGNNMTSAVLTVDLPQNDAKFTFTAEGQSQTVTMGGRGNGNKPDETSGVSVKSISLNYNNMVYNLSLKNELLVIIQ